MIERVQECGSQGDRGPRVGAPGTKEQTGPKTEHDDPDVLDRVEGEQPLQVVLKQRVGDTADSRESAEGQHQHTEPDRQRPEPIDEHANKAVNRHLDHHAAHQRRRRCRCDRVCKREPTVHRHQPRLGAHAHESSERDRDLKPRALRDDTARAEGPGVGGEQYGDPGTRARQMGDREIEEDGPARLVVTSRDEDDRCGQQGHQLPAGEKADGVAGAQHLGEDEHERSR